LTTVPSRFGPKESADRLETEIKAKGMTVFARIDHAARSAQTGMALGPTELLIFGNAKTGTPLMQTVQTTGIDLPLRALVYRDASGNTWLSYNAPAWGAKQHSVAAEGAGAIDAMSRALEAVTKKDTTPP